MWVRIKKVLRNKQGRVISVKVVEVERKKVTRGQARRLRAIAKQRKR